MSNLTDYLLQPSVGRPGLWVQIKNNVSGATFISTSASGADGGFTLPTPTPGDYTVYVSSVLLPANDVGWVITSDTHYQIPAIGGGPLPGAGTNSLQVVTTASVTVLTTSGSNPQAALLLQTNVTTLTIPTAIVPAGTLCALTLWVQQDGTGGRTMVWPGTISWAGQPPILSNAPNAVDVFQLLSVDGGNNWIGLSGAINEPAAKSANYTAKAGDVVLCTAGGGGFTVTLPAAPPAGTTVTIKKVDSGAGTITVVGSTGNLDGAANATISLQYHSLTVMYDGTNWWIL